jgi:predicted dehydrogenase
VTINVALVGLGYWGPNLARNLAIVDGGELYALCDAQPDRLQRIGRQYPGARQYGDFDALLADEGAHAIVVATPVSTHFDLARRALRAGKHVLVEKPLAQTSEQCTELIECARGAGLVLMTGHVFLYNAAVRQMKEYIDSGELGEIYYVYSQRLNLGQVRHDVNALWNFAPHDMSILMYWLDAQPERVMARGYAYVQDGIEDVVFMTLDFPGGVGANVHISWLDPFKTRRMTVVGSKKMIVYDDVSTDSRLTIYDKGVTRSLPARDSARTDSFETFGEFQLLLRAGDVLIPKVDLVEPLRVECQHFVDCIRSGEQPLSDGVEGLRVVRALEAAQASMAAGGVAQHVRSGT